MSSQNSRYIAFAPAAFPRFDFASSDAEDELNNYCVDGSSLDTFEHCIESDRNIAKAVQYIMELPARYQCETFVMPDRDLSYEVMHVRRYEQVYASLSTTDPIQVRFAAILYGIFDHQFHSKAPTRSGMVMPFLQAIEHNPSNYIRYLRSVVFSAEKPNDDDLSPVAYKDLTQFIMRQVPRPQEWHTYRNAMIDYVRMRAGRTLPLGNDHLRRIYQEKLDRATVLENAIADKWSDTAIVKTELEPLRTVVRKDIRGYELSLSGLY